VIATPRGKPLPLQCFAVLKCYDGRVVSERSLEQACHHLLRHLDDAHALEKNELIAPRRLSVPAIKRLLRAAAADLLSRDGGPASAHAMRQHAILTRCDLNGEPHKVVAAECGLSMRQFYRERSTMIRRLSVVLAERLNEQSSGPAFAIDIVSLELARARSLQYGGYPECAHVVLRSIVEGSDDPETVVTAGCRLVSLGLERYEFESAREHLNQLQRYVLRHAADGNFELEAQRVACERRNLLWFCGEEAQARRLDEAENDSLMRLARCGYRPAQEFAAAALTDTGRRALSAGLFERAQAAADAAQSALYVTEQAPADVRIALLTFSGVLLSIQRRERASVLSTFLEATSLAVRNGLSELAVLASLALSIDDQMRGDGVMARERVREIVPLALSIASPYNKAKVHLRRAELASAAEDAPEARAAMDAAASCVLPNSVLSGVQDLVNALVFLTAREFSAARSCAERAATAAQAQDNVRVAGNALYALALACAGLNAKSAAIGAIDNAIGALEKHGDPSAVEAARRTRAEIAGRVTAMIVPGAHVLP
jgi:hypothetical protein